MWPEALRQLVRGLPSLGGVLRAVPMEAAAEQGEREVVRIGQGEHAAPLLLLPLSEVTYIGTARTYAYREYST